MTQPRYCKEPIFASRLLKEDRVNHFCNRSQVQGSTFRVREKAEMDPRNPRKNCGFCHIIAKCHVPDPPASPVMYGTGISQEVGNGGQVCGDVEAVGFLVQNVYKMAYGDENTTFEPLNL